MVGPAHIPRTNDVTCARIASGQPLDVS